MKKALIAVVVVLAAIGIWLLVKSDEPKDSAAPTPTTESTTQPAGNVPEDEVPDEADLDRPTGTSTTITYTDNGFNGVPASVKRGTVITINNNSSSDLEFSSDDHPVHRDNTELNTSVIGPGESTTVTVNKSGSWGFHNHLKDSHSGTLVVE